jgi:cysteinyl-tRNA synthetase
VSQSFTDTLDDDLNISGALASLFEFVKKISLPLSRSRLNARERDDVLAMMKKMDGVLGVMDFREEVFSEEVLKLLRERESLRRAGQWQASDELRGRLLSMGVEVSDTSDGMVWRLK